MENEEQAKEELLCPFLITTINGEFAASQMFSQCKKERCAAFFDGICLRAREPLMNYVQHRDELMLRFLRRRDDKEERP